MTEEISEIKIVREDFMFFVDHSAASVIIALLSLDLVLYLF